MEPLGATATIPAAELRPAFEINVIAVAALTAAVLSGMLDAGWGRIVSIAIAIAAQPDGMVRANAYAATKAALEAHTINLAAELCGSGVTANVYRPGRVDTAMQGWIRAQDPDHIGAVLHGRFNRSIAEGTLITPEQSAAVLLARLTGDDTGPSGTSPPPRRAHEPFPILNASAWRAPSIAMGSSWSARELRPGQRRHDRSPGRWRRVRDVATTDLTCHRHCDDLGIERSDRALLQVITTSPSTGARVRPHPHLQAGARAAILPGSGLLHLSRIRLPVNLFYRQLPGMPPLIEIPEEPVGAYGERREQHDDGDDRPQHDGPARVHGDNASL